MPLEGEPKLEPTADTTVTMFNPWERAIPEVVLKQKSFKQIVNLEIVVAGDGLGPFKVTAEREFENKE